MSSDWLARLGKTVRTTAGFGVGAIAIAVSTTDLRPGERVEGTLTLTLDEPTDAERLVVRLTATGTRVRYEMRDGKKTRIRRTETLYSFDLELSGKTTYPAGRQEWPFSIRIPTHADDKSLGDLIPQLGVVSDVLKAAMALSEGAKRPTKWTLRGFLDIPWKRNVKRKLQLQVSSEVGG